MTRAELKETLRNIMNEESDYQIFFRKALEKAGKSITDMSDDEKKAFFNKIDAAWDGKGEKNEGNAFGAAVTAAKENGEDEFEVGGKTYKVEEGKKRFRQQNGIGKAKYTISFHDGKKKHKDGSDFFDIQIFKNQKDVDAFRKALLQKGFIEESVNEAAGKEAMGIAAFTGTRGDAVQKFIDDNKLNAKKLFNYVKGGRLTDRLNFVTAIVGTPGNPVQKRMIKMFGESVNEDTKKRFDVDFYKVLGDRQTSHEEIIRGDKFSDVISQATKVAKSKGMNYVEFYYKDAFIGSIDKKSNYTFKKGRNSEKSPLSVNEEKYPIAIEKFNKELIKHPMVKKAAQHYKKTPAEIVKVLQQRLYSKGDKTGNTKEVWIDFKDTTSGITIKHKMKFNESVNEGRAFINAAKKAKAEGKTEFEFNGKTYPVTLKESTINEDANMNKKVKAYLDKGLSDLKRGGSNHLFAVMHVLMGALTDANFHSEAKKVSSIFGSKAQYEGDPMGKQDAIKIYHDMGENIASLCKWDGEDIAKAIGFYTSMTIGRPLGQKIENLV